MPQTARQRRIRRVGHPFEPVEPLQQSGDHDLPLQPRQTRPRAKMRSCAERDMTANIGTIDPEIFRYSEDRLVMIGRTNPDFHPVAIPHHDIAERLRVARAQALANRRQPARPATVVVDAGGNAAALGSVWWMRFGTIAPLVALVVGLVGISVWQDDQRFKELAEVDAALLTDDLPPAAYTDPGFAQFLKTEGTASR